MVLSRKSTLVYEVSRQLAEAVTERPPPKIIINRIGVRRMTSMTSAAETAANAARLLACKDREALLNGRGKCEYCKRRHATTQDHFFPLVRNGRPTGYCNDAWNTVPCCKECNSSKAGRTFAEWFSTDSKYAPCGGAVWAKFARYDVLFQKHCLRMPMDATWNAWWEDTNAMISEFLTALQARVDARIVHDHGTIAVADTNTKRSKQKRKKGVYVKRRVRIVALKATRLPTAQQQPAPNARDQDRKMRDARYEARCRRAARSSS